MKQQTLKTNLDTLRVNVPRILKVRASLSDLHKALTGSIAGNFWNYVRNSNDGSLDTGGARDFLAQKNFVFDESFDRLAVTVYGNGLLFDHATNFEDIVRQTHSNKGFDAARGRIEMLTRSVLNADQLNAEAITAAKDMLAEMDGRVATIAARHQWLATATQEISGLISTIENETNVNTQRRTVLETELANSQTVKTAPPPPAPASRVGAIKNRLQKLLKRDNAPVVNASAGISRQLESDLLRATLEASLLRAESLFFGSILNLLRDEETRIDQAESVVANGAEQHIKKGQSAEVSGGWNIAAGELTLNDSQLTNAVVEHFWSDRDLLFKLIASHYHEVKGQDIFVATEGVFREADLEDIAGVVAGVVDEAISDWTIVDVIAIRCNSADDFTGTVIEAIRQVASRQFLTVGFDQFIPHRTYATISYAESNNPQANSSFENLLEEIVRVVDANVEVQHEYFDNEVLTFYIEDQSVPITAMDFFAGSIDEYDAAEARNNPLYTPHPDIYQRRTHGAASRQSFAAGSSLRREKNKA